MRGVEAHLAESIKDLVKVDEYLALCDFCNVVHALARVVPYTGILVAKAGKHRGHDFLEVAGDFGPQGYRGSGQSYETTIASVGLVDGIGILMAQLMDDLCYPIMVLGGEGITDEAFEFECPALAPIVELVVEGFCDVGVHGEGLSWVQDKSLVYMAQLPEPRMLRIPRRGGGVAWIRVRAGRGAFTLPPRLGVSSRRQDKTMLATRESGAPHVIVHKRPHPCARSLTPAILSHAHTLLPARGSLDMPWLPPSAIMSAPRPFASSHPPQ